ncbi:hypothetical protein [Flavimaricola marinus]|uniref:Uncharacterized protein n=1 Tax=Flavimaricola marinus TaxID=1819565 RepID=A0A238L982_9RHOB|nr:hypothetical protein [Flavimaricola marinus]SMY06267.1 hypothetical protein LOM8899_00390 [Flavimaricola marinus]
MDAGPDIRIDGLSFEGFEASFADRATAVFEQALADGAAGLTLTGHREIDRIDLDSVDFSSPDTCGRSLAAALLRALSQ